MIDTDKYEGHTPAPWMMGEYKGRPSIHAGDETFVRSIARGLNPSQTADHTLLLDAPLLLAEVKRLRIIETAAQLYGDYCRERHHQMDDAPYSFEQWLDWMLNDDALGDMMIHYDQEVLDDMKSKATYYSPEGCGFFTDYSKLNKGPSFVERMRGKKKND